MGSNTTIQRYGLSSQGKPVGAGEENLGGRSTPMYVGIATALAGVVAKTDITITLSDSSGFGLGDYVTTWVKKLCVLRRIQVVTSYK